MNKISQISDNENNLLTEESIINEIPDWDSLNTVDLEMELESEFNISFETGEFQEYKSISDLLNAVNTKLGK